MIALWIFLGIVFVFAVLLMVRVGVVATYDETGATVFLRIGPVRCQIVPVPEARRLRKAKKEKPEEKVEKSIQKAGGALSEFRTMLEPILRVLGKFKRKLRIEVLELTYLSGAEDPAKAAIGYGAASAGLGMIASILERHFHIRKHKFCTGVDFTIQKPVISAHAVLSLRVGQLLSMGIAFAISYRNKKQKRKKETEMKTVDPANPA